MSDFEKQLLKTLNLIEKLDRSIEKNKLTLQVYGNTELRNNSL